MSERLVPSDFLYLIDTLKPKEAKEVAKKLLEAGKLTIQKKAPVKRSGFKRVGELPGQVICYRTYVVAISMMMYYHLINRVLPVRSQTLEMVLSRYI